VISRDEFKSARFSHECQLKQRCATVYIAANALDLAEAIVFINFFQKDVDGGEGDLYYAQPLKG